MILGLCAFSADESENNRLRHRGDGLFCLVKVFIQHCHSHEFLMPNGEWTPRLECAWHFDSSVTALELMRERKLENVQVVFKFGDAKYDFELAKTKGC